MASKTLFFSVGEPSGDQHAARLIDHLTSHRGTRTLDGSTKIRCRGFGGPAMSRAGCDLDLNLTGHAVVGLVEVLPHLAEFIRFAGQAESIFASGTVDGVVLVDFPGFNWHIARRAKKHGIPVYYYCPPQLWAWGGWRVNKMRRLVDHVLAVLPIEETYFREHQIPVTRVGHPFFDAVAEQKLDAPLMKTFRESELDGVRTVAVLPGSRDREVHGNFPLQLETIRRLMHQPSVAQRGPVRFAVAAYRDGHSLWCREQLTPADRDLPIDFYVNRTSEIVQAAHCAMMVSGSVSLELMARGTPAAVLYRVGRLLHFIGRRMLRVDTITLPNLMSPRKVFPEFVSVGNPEPAIDFLQETMTALLTDPFYYNRVRSELDSLRLQYGRPGASAAAAGHLLDWLDVSEREETVDAEQTKWRSAA